MSACPFLAKAAATSGKGTDDAHRPAAAAGAEAEAAAAAAGASCPFARRVSIDPTASATHGDGRAIAATAASPHTCPVTGARAPIEAVACPRTEAARDGATACADEGSGGARAEEEQVAIDGAAREKTEKGGAALLPPARCPYGFDSGLSASRALGPLSCVRCKALMCDPTRCRPCNHLFCSGCISAFRDCPICGADIDSLAPDDVMQAHVDAFLHAHVLARHAQHAHTGDAAAADTDAASDSASVSSASVSAVNNGGDAVAATAAAAAAGAGDAKALGSSGVTAASSEAQQQHQQHRDAAIRRRMEAAVLHAEERALDLDRSDPGSFLFLQAMRALQGGNVASARARLLLCANSLKAMLMLEGEEDGTTADKHSSSAAAASAAATAGATAAVAAAAAGSSAQHGSVVARLGAVLGSMADCCLMVGDTDAAVQSYTEAIEWLSAVYQQQQQQQRQQAGDCVPDPAKKGGSLDGELTHVFCVSLNKLGDLLYRNGQMESALPMYQQALEVRRKVLTDADADAGDDDPGMCPAASASNKLAKLVDVVVSTTKVADLQASLGHVHTAHAGFQSAAWLMGGAEGELQACNDEGLKAKARATLAFIQEQLAANTHDTP